MSAQAASCIVPESAVALGFRALQGSTGPWVCWV